jgi:hypothetical protein
MRKLVGKVLEELVCPVSSFRLPPDHVAHLAPETPQGAPQCGKSPIEAFDLCVSRYSPLMRSMPLLFDHNGLT